MKENLEEENIDHKNTDISRKGFISILASLFLIFSGVLWFKWRRKEIPTKFIGPTVERGHAIRENFLIPEGLTPSSVETAIIGGGISGLSAAWYLRKHGYANFQLFELEDKTGGNSISGENRLGKYPWGAHYLPTPGENAHYVKELLEEVGALKNGKYDERYLVHEVEERLFIYGIWQAGLKPLMGARAEERREFEYFKDLIVSYMHAKGRDGKSAFTIPVSKSSRDPKFLAFDRMLASEFLASHNLKSRRFLWYIDYCLRDEFGSNHTNTSAWALLHYFASREHAHNLVWPEGNGFLADYLRGQVNSHVLTGYTLRSIVKEKTGYKLYFTNYLQEKPVCIRAKNIVFSAPKFILPYVYPELKKDKKEALHSFAYSPWMTANILVNHFAEEEPAWDNVTFASKSLGYVVAEHQKIGKLPHARTLTFFHAFDEDDTLHSRRKLLSMREGEAIEFILRELEVPHPNIRENIEEVGVYRWAHAMVRPVPGFISGEGVRLLDKIDTNFFAAHSDLSGMSNFEEAQYRGVIAAKKVLNT
ncbi:MAG: hypothetical protein LDLANPLL_02275 [Turneriella sp.]|nr:hypothetical protein [Turneriella sp.]